MKNFFVVFALMSLIFTPFSFLPPCAAAAEVVVGIITDGPQARFPLPLDILKQEVMALMGKEFQVRFPEEKRRHGEWSLERIQNVLHEELADPQVDVILTLGLVAANEAAKMPDLPKPVIAPYVGDAKLQAFPFEDGASGKKNFVYLTSHGDSAKDIEMFHQMVGFTHLAVLVDELWIQTLPQLPEIIERMRRQLQTDISLVPVTDSARSALKSLPAGADAVLLAPLLRFAPEDVEELSDGLIMRRLPSFSTLGRSEVERGIMATTAGQPAELVSYARRIAVNLLRILLGKDAGTLPVAFAGERRLALNLRTARAIGFSPRWAYLLDADILYDDQPVSGLPLTLTAAMRRAVGVNLDLQAAELSVWVAADEVKRARSSLLPKLDVGAASRRIDSDRAAPAGEAENSTDVELSGSQLLYADQPYAEYEVSRLLKSSTDYQFTASALDLLQSAGRAYLNVLRATAREGVRRSNLSVSRRNLELARARFRIGYSGRADVLRWESQIATDLQNLLAAEADRAQLETELNRLLHRSQQEPVFADETDINSLLALFQTDRFRRFYDTPAGWKSFQSFLTAEALTQAPELRGQDEQVAAQRRRLTAARRSFYVPDVSLVGRYNQNLDRSGEGGSRSGTGLNDDEWRFGLEATIPLFTGGQRRAQLARADHELRQLDLQRQALAERVEARMRGALQRAAGSYPAIKLSRDAAEAARENLELVTDSYAKGAVGITDLLEAQNASLSAELGAVSARYAFLIDWLEVLRALSSFDMLLVDGAWEEILIRMERFAGGGG